MSHTKHLPGAQVRCHRGGRLVLGGVCQQRLRWSIFYVLRHHDVFGQIVRTARTEHERVHAHANMLALRFDALPHEHAGALVFYMNKYEQ